jgi:ABC-type branched-subunit amino acid transport system permease subunit
LGIVAIAIYVPHLLIAALSNGLQHDPEVIAIVPALHIATFAAAVAMTCLLRHAVYAAIFTIAILQLSIVATWLAWIVLGQLGWAQLPDEWLELIEKTTVIVSGLMICLVASTIAAWFIVRNDWGRKSRY